MVELLAHRHVSALARTLQHDAEASLPRQRPRARVGAQDCCFAACAVAVSLKNFDRRGLAGTVRAEQSERLTALDVEAHPVEGRELPILFAQIAHAHNGVRSCHDTMLAPRRAFDQSCVG